MPRATSQGAAFSHGRENASVPRERAYPATPHLRDGCRTHLLECGGGGE
jgi:hypothetical protein